MASRPLYASGSSTQIKEMPDNEFSNMLGRIGYLYSTDPFADVDVVLSGGNAGPALTDTRYRSGPLGQSTGDQDAFDDGLNEYDRNPGGPELLTVANYDRLNQVNNYTAGQLPTANFDAAYYSNLDTKPVKWNAATNCFQEMTYLEVVDAFIDEWYNSQSNPSSSNPGSAGAYFVSSNTSETGATRVSSTPVFVDTVADASSYQTALIGGAGVNYITNNFSAQSGSGTTNNLLQSTIGGSGIDVSVSSLPGVTEESIPPMTALDANQMFSRSNLSGPGITKIFTGTWLIDRPFTSFSTAERTANRQAYPGKNYNILDSYTIQQADVGSALIFVTTTAYIDSDRKPDHMQTLVISGPFVFSQLTGSGLPGGTTLTSRQNLSQTFNSNTGLRFGWHRGVSDPFGYDADGFRFFSIRPQDVGQTITIVALSTNIGSSPHDGNDGTGGGGGNDSYYFGGQYDVPEPRLRLLKITDPNASSRFSATATNNTGYDIETPVGTTRSSGSSFSLTSFASTNAWTLAAGTWQTSQVVGAAAQSNVVTFNQVTGSGTTADAALASLGGGIDVSVANAGQMNATRRYTSNSSFSSVNSSFHGVGKNGWTGGYAFSDAALLTHPSSGNAFSNDTGTTRAGFRIPPGAAYAKVEFALSGKAPFDPGGVNNSGISFRNSSNQSFKGFSGIERNGQIFFSGQHGFSATVSNTSGKMIYRSSSIFALPSNASHCYAYVFKQPGMYIRVYFWGGATATNNTGFDIETPVGTTRAAGTSWILPSTTATPSGSWKIEAGRYYISSGTETYQDHFTTTNYYLHQMDQQKSTQGSGYKTPLVVDYDTNGDAQGLRAMTYQEFDDFFDPLVKYVTSSLSGYRLSYNVNGNGINIGNPIINQQMVGVTSQLSTRFVNVNDYRSQMFPNGVVVAQDTHRFKLEKY